MTRIHLSRRRIAWLVGGAAGFILLVGLIWLAATALLARSEVAKARDALSQLRDAVVAGDTAKARAEAAVVAAHADRAHALTTGPAWWTASQLPWAGAPLQTVRGAASQADVLGRDVLPALIRIADELNPGTLRDGDTVNIGRLAAAAPELHRASVATDAAARSIAGLPHKTWLGAVDRSRSTLQTEIDDIDGTVAAADRTARILPAMLGQDRPKRYFVGLQNSAESRGLGGLPGAFAIVVADHGKITFNQFADDSALSGVRADVDLGKDFDARYKQDDPYGLYVNSDVSPDFRDAAQIWAAMWQKKTGQHVDGALTLDPTALSNFLRVTGPATLPDGEQVGADDIVKLTESEIYARYPTDPTSAVASNAANAARKAFLLGVAKAVDEKLLTGGNTRSLLDAAARASSERRLLVWSADPAIERQLMQTSLAGTLDAHGHPFSGFTVTNAAASKLDYYLDRTMTYQRSGCGSTRDVTATLTLTNTAPTSGLPSYVTSREDRARATAKPGGNRLLVSYYATPGTQVKAVTLDGAPTPFAPTTEKGLVVFTLDVELPIGKARTLSVRLQESAASGSLVLLRQPLVRPMTVDVGANHC